MKKIIVGIFLIFSMFAYAKVNDELNLFKPEEKEKIEAEIVEISEKRGIRIYVNTLLENEGFAVENAEKTIIFNLTKPEENKIKTELKFSKDMEIDEYQDNIDNILTLKEDKIQEKNNAEYVVEVLNEIDNILENVKVEEPIVVEEEIVQEKKNGFFIGMGIAFFVIFAMIIRVLMVKYRRSFREEIDIISRKR